MAMKLIQARIRGLSPLTASRWFELSPHLNLLQFPDRKYGKNFLQTLQTINPTYTIKTVKPFAHFPEFIEQGGYTRRVNPAKRTVALAVFSANPSLVKELATVSDWLYETDRIEVGRRLDYSRWINFVELASSTRWSEISADMQTLLDQAHRLAPELATPPAHILRTLRPTDRIKNELQDQLAHWLQNLPSELQRSSRQLIETTLAAVMRAEHFKAARKIVRTRLPLFVVLGGSEPDSASLHNLLQLISDRARSLGKESINDENPFLHELNDHLEKLPFSGMLHIDNSPTGVLLTIDGKPVHMATDGPLSSLRQMQAKASLAIAFSRVAYRTEPILLFAGPEQTLPNTLHAELADFVIDMSNICQCLYSFSDIDIFPNDVAGRRYSAADLSMAEKQGHSSPKAMDEQM